MVRDVEPANFRSTKINVTIKDQQTNEDSFPYAWESTHMPSDLLNIMFDLPCFPIKQL